MTTTKLPRNSSNSQLGFYLRATPDECLRWIEENDKNPTVKVKGKLISLKDFFHSLLFNQVPYDEMEEIYGAIATALYDFIYLNGPVQKAFMEDGTHFYKMAERTIGNELGKIYDYRFKGYDKEMMLRQVPSHVFHVLVNTKRAVNLEGRKVSMWSLLQEYTMREHYGFDNPKLNDALKEAVKALDDILGINASQRTQKEIFTFGFTTATLAWLKVFADVPVRRGK